MPVNRYLPRSLPEPLQPLGELAVDLRWSWHHGADELWRTVDRELWEATGNPWLILETVSNTRLNELARDRGFLDALRRQIAVRDEHLSTEGWFPERYGDAFDGNIAYFSMEFGLSESLPIYSGGLGVLAGDFLKTACDLDVPVIGVGLLYQQGYFHQAIDADGEQLEFYPVNDPTMLPVVPLRDDDGEWIRITVDLPGRLLWLRAWQAKVGRRRLLLLDSNDLRNHPSDRGITSELYGGGPEMRLQQEMVLGIGGWRLLRRVSLECPVCHLNEGHAAFAILERARCYMKQTGQPFTVALRATRAGNLFTTHTPVMAGFDRFEARLFAAYFQSYADELGIGIENLAALGRADPADSVEPFNMAFLAMRGAGAVNGVSRLHGHVSRGIFQSLFPRWPRSEVPVGHVTNGVHVPTWDSIEADSLWTRACGKARWLGALEGVETDLRELSDETLWNFRSASRRRLVGVLRERLLRQHCCRGLSQESARQWIDMLEPDTLTLGFARRFAEYKRTNLLLAQQDRLVGLLCNRDRPVQLVIAGKAHPADTTGKSLLRAWQNFMKRPEVRGRALFVEDYDLGAAEQLTQGVDVWINTPRRPWEASGTSGMKVLVNGGLNLSELDGWWAEAYDPGLGWSLGDGREHDDADAWDRTEAEQLYRLLEREVVPCFYRRDQQGLPREWIARMRESMACLTPRFSSNRMLREYVEGYYLPLSAHLRERGVEAAVDLQEWSRKVARHWPRIHFGNLSTSEDLSGYRFEIQVYLDELSADLVQVELYAEQSGDREAFRLVLERGAPLVGADSSYVYRGTAPADRPFSDYTPRIVPAHELALVPLEANHILWYR
ncbi:MAG TPA: alpha-glucan family phosphorylase [Gammaproteobacteria bacterium]|nr:alpha-glucan family phosphorylase [Gammaproteobacteria bacterium]